MTSSVEAESVTVADEINTVHKRIDSDVGYRKNRQGRHILKSKENTDKHKCNKLLKRKLKQYKLRQDGTEDQDVLDVSNILVSSLIIKSPGNPPDPFFEEEDLDCFGELRPKNYLFKMVRRKEVIKMSSSLKSPNIDIKHNEVDEMPETIANQEKKHMNAFKLLMDSRNKSIGSNSPGKEKNDSEDSEEMLEKKNTKAKRNLLLQKMAEAKGYLKNKEMEEYQDKLIQRKMDKRAERLKNMIQKDSKPAEDLDDNKTQVVESQKHNNKDEIEVINNNDSKKQPKAFQIIDIFNTLNDPMDISHETKNIPKEDRDFLKKLSPSLKKKESMLSYFKKVEKEPDLDDSENDNLIKVKLQFKTKRKGRKKKLSLKRDTDLDKSPEINNENNDITCDPIPPLPEVAPLCVDSSELQSTVERQKRKRNSKIDDIHCSEAIITALNNESRPKRSIKRPVKYTDDACMSSSDEDLHIFTPKKKKHVENANNDKATENLKTKQIVPDVVKPKVEKKIVKDPNTLKKPVKLAPIFASKQLDSAALEAKQKFLQSGVPEKLKKIIQQEKNQQILSTDFPVVVHVQQRESIVENIIQPFLKVTEDEYDDICVSTYEQDAFKTLLNCNEPIHNDITGSFKRSTHAVLQSIKELHPKFPVYRTYRYLRAKGKGELKDSSIDFDNSIEVINDVIDVTNDSPDILNWTDKYKATSTKQIIGNFESIKELRKWLITWTENQMKSKSRTNPGSDSSDYYQSDTDSGDSIKTMNNLLILIGPTGCGKTSSVYAVAADLSMKVIEVNASGKRTGKIMLQDLQEATQSHKVNRGTGTDSSQKSQEKKVKREEGLTEALKNNKKRGRPKKSAGTSKKSCEKPEVLSSTPLSQESSRTDMSLILIDDADIVFDQDDGFSSAIVQLVQCSKRPVILITSSLVCPHLQRFFQNGKILKMSPLSPRLLGTWLDVMCLADSGVSWPGVGAKFLNYFKGDIRKTINYLQFYTSIYAHSLSSDEETASQNVDYYKTNIDDENSSMSWADQEDLEGRKLTSVINGNFNMEENCMWTDFVNKYSNLNKFRYPLHLFDIWWSVPRLLSPPTAPDTAQKANKSQNKGQHVRELEAIADAIDAISLSDYITRPDTSFDITAQPWYSPEYDSASEQDNIEDYINRYEIGDEICHTLVNGCVVAAQDVLNCDRISDISIPEMSMQKERDKIVARHKSLSSYLIPWATSDRKSLALDYWPLCRAICRIEKSKNDGNMNTKRNNRFCHYLKSLSVLCNSNTFDNLCDSLSNEGTEKHNNINY